MAILKRTYTKPLPKNAELFERKGQTFARWIDGKGKKQTAPVITGRNGDLRIRKEARTKTVQYRDADGIVQRVATGCRDAGAAANVAAELKKTTELVRSGVVSSSEADSAKAGLLPMADHIQAYRGHLVAKDASPRHISMVTRRLERLSDECKFKRLSDMTANSLGKWLTLQAEQGMGASTRNGYRVNAVSFANWCKRTNRIRKNPFDNVPLAQVKNDRRHERRSLTLDEIGRILTAARLRPLAEYGRPKEKTICLADTGKRSNWTYAPLTWEGLQAANSEARKRLKENPSFVYTLELRGKQRGLIYSVLLTTGLRKSELASIRISDLELEGPRPSLYLRAENEKARRGAVIPLRADVVAALEEWLSIRLAAMQATARAKGGAVAVVLSPETHLFDVPSTLSKSFNADLAAADIAKHDDRKRVLDVHSLRVTFNTQLLAAGVPLRTVQAAMRHSDPKLTANVYTDPRLLDVGQAVNHLPPMEPTRAESEAMAATGTDDVPTEEADSKLALVLALDHDFSSKSESLPVIEAGSKIEERYSHKPLSGHEKTPDFSGGNIGAGKGIRTLDPQLGKLNSSGLKPLSDKALTESPDSACTCACTQDPKNANETPPLTADEQAERMEQFYESQQAENEWTNF